MALWIVACLKVFIHCLYSGSSFPLLLSSSVFAFESPDVQVQKSKLVTSQKQSQGLSQSQALTAALKELSLAEKDVKDLQVVREKDTYKIRFLTNRQFMRLLSMPRMGSFSSPSSTPLSKRQ